jgi:hypothetical protein
MNKTLRTQKTALFILLAILFGVVRTLVSYSGFGFEDQIEQLPLIYRSFDNSYLQNDFFVNAALESAARTNYIRFIRLFTNAPENLPLLFFIFTLILNTAIALVTFLTGRTLFNSGFFSSGTISTASDSLGPNSSSPISTGPDSSALFRSNPFRFKPFSSNFFHSGPSQSNPSRSIPYRSNLAALTAATLVMLVPTFHLGASPHLFVTYFIPSSMAAPLALLAALLAIQKKITWAMLAGGAASLVHPLFGLETMALLLFAWLVSELLQKDLVLVDQPRKGQLKERYLQKEQLLEEPILKEHSQQRLLKKDRLQEDLLHREWLQKEHLKTIAKKMIIPALLLTIFALLSILPQLNQPFQLETRQFIHILGHFRHPHHYIPGSFPVTHYLLFLLFLSAFSYAWYALRKTMNSYNSRFILVLNLSILAACFAGYLFVEIIPLRLAAVAQTFRLLYLFKWTGMIFFAGFMVRYFTEKQTRKGFKMVAGAVIVMFVVALFFKGLNKPENLKQPGGNSPEAFPKTLLSGEMISTPDEQAAEIAEFAKKNTPADAVFLTPHNFGFFRLSAERAIVADFKSFPFTDRAMLEWYERINNCYGLPEPLNRSGFENELLMTANYAALDDTKLKELQEQYNFTYAVLFSETTTRYEILFSNEKYKIIALQ